MSRKKYVKPYFTNQVLIRNNSPAQDERIPLAVLFAESLVGKFALDGKQRTAYFLRRPLFTVAQKHETFKPGQSKGKHYAEYIADKTGSGSFKSKLKVAIDKTTPS